jgi:hypothetical protein
MTPVSGFQWGVSIILFAGVVALMLWIVRLSKKRGATEEENEHIHNLNEKLSDRPITDSDLIKRLRDKASDGRRDQGKP